MTSRIQTNMCCGVFMQYMDIYGVFMQYMNVRTHMTYFMFFFVSPCIQGEASCPGLLEHSLCCAIGCAWNKHSQHVCKVSSTLSKKSLITHGHTSIKSNRSEPLLCPTATSTLPGSCPADFAAAASVWKISPRRLQQLALERS